jgi:hypothetical protein
MATAKTIADIPYKGNNHIQITIADIHLRSRTLTRIRSGLWIVTDSGTNLLKTESESEAVTKFLEIISEKETK